MSEQAPVPNPEAIPKRYVGLDMVIDPAVFHWDRLVAYAHDTYSDRDVVVKMKDRKCLENEANALESLRHPQIPELIDDDLEAENPYIVVDAMPHNPRLLDYLRNNPRPQFVARMAMSTLEVLSYIHDEGWGHFDIKPDNLGLTLEGPVSLFDFDLAAPLGEDPAWKTSPTRISVDKRITLPQGETGVIGSTGFISKERLNLEQGHPADDRFGLAETINELMGNDPRVLAPVVVRGLKGRHGGYESDEEMAEDIRHLMGSRVLMALAA